MPTLTDRNHNKTDEYGIERAYQNELNFIDKYRHKWPWFDHVMLMQERYATLGGSQFAAGITYFSVLSMFPLLMLVFAVVATVLASHPDMLAEIQNRVASLFDGSIGDTANEIITTAINQRGTMYGIGGLTALWSGLNWINNVRYGVSMMWKYPVDEGNFFKTKIKDLGDLITIFLALVLAFGITAVGNSGLTLSLLTWLQLEHIPGITIITSIVSLALGFIAGYLVFFWLLKKLPRGEVPMKSALQASLIGAVAFEIFKQLATLFFSTALKNPAGATFGPIIGLMVMFYLLWTLLMYCTAWCATTKESLAIAQLDTPVPAVINVREEISVQPPQKQTFGIGVALGAVAASLLFLRRR